MSYYVPGRFYNYIMILCCKIVHFHVCVTSIVMVVSDCLEMPQDSLLSCASVFIDLGFYVYKVSRIFLYCRNLSPRSIIRRNSHRIKWDPGVCSSEIQKNYMRTIPNKKRLHNILKLHFASDFTVTGILNSYFWYIKKQPYNSHLEVRLFRQKIYQPNTKDPFTKCSLNHLHYYPIFSSVPNDIVI